MSKRLGRLGEVVFLIRSLDGIRLAGIEIGDRRHIEGTTCLHCQRRLRAFFICLCSPLVSDLVSTTKKIYIMSSLTVFGTI